ncbi:hypothetical protein BHM03_00019371 [Ensete ventricosum]|nr:hypothetical protein BHM03_00019371 [Ensete ventricosum]
MYFQASPRGRRSYLPSTLTPPLLVSTSLADLVVKNGDCLKKPSWKKLPLTLTPPLLVSTSLADLVVKNHGHLKKPSRKKKLPPSDFDSSAFGPDLPC